MTRMMTDLSLETIKAEEDALTDFQFAVIDAMNAQGLKQVDLAKLMGVTPARVSQLLSPEANPTLKLTGRALRALGLDAKYARKGDIGTVHDAEWHVMLGEIEHTVKGSLYETAQRADIVRCQTRVRTSQWSFESGAANENSFEIDEHLAFA